MPVFAMVPIPRKCVALSWVQRIEPVLKIILICNHVPTNSVVIWFALDYRCAPFQKCQHYWSRAENHSTIKILKLLDRRCLGITTEPDHGMVDIMVEEEIPVVTTALDGGLLQHGERMVSQLISDILTAQFIYQQGISVQLQNIGIRVLGHQSRQGSKLSQKSWTAQHTIPLW